MVLISKVPEWSSLKISLKNNMRRGLGGDRKALYKFDFLYNIAYNLPCITMGELCPFLYSSIRDGSGRRGKVHGGLPELENVEQSPGISDTEPAPHSGAMLFDIENERVSKIAVYAWAKSPMKKSS